MTAARARAALPPVLASPDPVQASITRWDGTVMAERANCQSFLSELFDVPAVPRPDPATGGIGPYRFDATSTITKPTAAPASGASTSIPMTTERARGNGWPVSTAGSTAFNHSARPAKGFAAF